MYKLVVLSSKSSKSSPKTVVSAKIRKHRVDVQSYRGFKRKAGGLSIINFLRQHQSAVKIKPLYLKHNTCYLTW
jgi:hypothetical protein